MKCNTCDKKASKYCYVILGDDRIYVAHCNSCFEVEMDLVRAWNDTYVEITESEFAMVEALE